MWGCVCGVNFNLVEDVRIEGDEEGVVEEHDAGKLEGRPAPHELLAVVDGQEVGGGQGQRGPIGRHQ